MAWIKTIAENEAEGSLKRQYDAAIKRAGRVFNIVKINSLKPDLMRIFMQLYLQLMYGPSPLTRAQREMIAVVVSKANNCFYWTEAHAEDLRSECNDDSLVAAIMSNYKTAGLNSATEVMLDYATDVTLKPEKMSENRIQLLRCEGFSDEAILDITHIIGYFNHINRVADALGVDLEDFMKEKGKFWT